MLDLTNAQWVAIGLVQLVDFLIAMIILTHLKWRFAMDRAELEGRLSASLQLLSDEQGRLAERVKRLASRIP